MEIIKIHEICQILLEKINFKSKKLLEIQKKAPKKH